MLLKFKIMPCLHQVVVGPIFSGHWMLNYVPFFETSLDIVKSTLFQTCQAAGLGAGYDAIAHFGHMNVIANKLKNNCHWYSHSAIASMLELLSILVLVSYNNRNPALGVLWSWHRVASPSIEIPIQICFVSGNFDLWSHPSMDHKETTHLVT